MTKEQANPLEVFAKHVFNKDNIWNPENYIQGRTINGRVEGKETSLLMQYCHGNSYCVGYIGERAIRIFGSYLQGYQIWIYDLGMNFDELNDSVTPFRVHPNSPEMFIPKILENL